MSQQRHTIPSDPAALRDRLNQPSMTRQEKLDQIDRHLAIANAQPPARSESGVKSGHSNPGPTPTGS